MVRRRELLAGTLQKLERACTLASAAFSGLLEHRKLPRDPSRMQCARWLHESCAHALRALNVQIAIEGEPPRGGLIVSNHLSYLDIPVLSATLPCVFVSKAEVEDWPIFGRYARWAGSVFVRRHDRADAARANTNIGDALQNGVPVVLFPEGTTTDGERVLRFHSTMLQPAIDADAPITPCAIGYELDEGDPAREVAWWGDMTLLPHIWNLLGKRCISARVVFGEPIEAGGDRKELSAVLHEEVVRLHERVRHTEFVQAF
jgi:1-acyl-sn-glycerol-3-phosphate acyltransferase